MFAIALQRKNVSRKFVLNPADFAILSIDLEKINFSVKSKKSIISQNRLGLGRIFWRHFFFAMRLRTFWYQFYNFTINIYGVMENRRNWKTPWRQSWVVRFWF